MNFTWPKFDNMAATDPSVAAIGTCVMPIVRSLALWASVKLFASAWLGNYAMTAGRRAALESVDRSKEVYSSGDWRTILQDWDGTVSQGVHRTDRPHGVIFKALLLLTALFSLASEFPKYELYPVNPPEVWGDLEAIAQALRGIIPCLAIVLLIFVPVGVDYVDMLTRFRQPGYKPTMDDRAIYVAHGRQMQMHMVGGALGFLVVPLSESVAAGLVLRHFFASTEGGMVRWADGTLASQMWLVMTLLRCLVLLTCIVCNVRFQFELFFRLRWKTVPLITAMPEHMLIRNNMWGMQTLAMSIWFVDGRAWETMGCITQAVFLVVAIPQGFWILWNTIRHLHFAVRMDAFLSEENLASVVDSIVKKQQAKLDNETSLEELRLMYERPAAERVAAVAASYPAAVTAAARKRFETLRSSSSVPEIAAGKAKLCSQAAPTKGKRHVGHIE